MNNKSKLENTINLALLFGFFVLTIVLEYYINPRGQWSMLLVCLKKGAIYSLVAVSLNLLNGFTGLFSLGQAGFMLIGAYTYAILTIPTVLKPSIYMYYSPAAVSFSLPEVLGNLMGGPGAFLGVMIAIILAGLITAGTAYLIGLPVLSLKTNYLAIATLGFAEIIRAICMWGKLGPITNGSNPLRSYVRQNFFKLKIESLNIDIGLQTFFFVVSAALCIGVIVLLVNSSYGRAFKAIREDEIAAEAMGINLYKHKQMSFCFGSFFTGVGGALLAIFMSSVAAINFDSIITYEILLIVVLGGLGSISGSVIGAMLFVFASEWWLRGLDSGTFIKTNWPWLQVEISSTFFRSGFRLVVFSVIIMLVVLFFRKGIMGDKELPAMVKGWFAPKRFKAGGRNV
jgi:branched-chain amino acid transport system permease protein